MHGSSGSIAGGNDNVNIVDNRPQTFGNTFNIFSERERSVRPSGKLSCSIRHFIVNRPLILALNPVNLSPPRPMRTESDPDTYARILLTQRIGYPLWRPNPSGLPVEHRKQGVKIGDVGKILYDGRFLFLFNVFLCGDDPANRWHIPNFTPLQRLDQETDATAYSRSGDAITSSGIEMRQIIAQVDDNQ